MSQTLNRLIEEHLSSSKVQTLNAQSDDAVSLEPLSSPSVEKIMESMDNTIVPKKSLDEEIKEEIEKLRKSEAERILEGPKNGLTLKDYDISVVSVPPPVISVKTQSKQPSLLDRLETFEKRLDHITAALEELGVI